MHACLSSSSPLGQSMKPSQRTWSSIQRYRPVRSGVGHANLSMPSSSAGGHSVTHDVTLIFCEIRSTQWAVYMEANADGHTAVPRSGGQTPFPCRPRTLCMQHVLQNPSFAESVLFTGKAYTAVPLLSVRRREVERPRLLCNPSNTG